jgi:hypothetical protein
LWSARELLAIDTSLIEVEAVLRFGSPDLPPVTVSRMTA